MRDILFCVLVLVVTLFVCFALGEAAPPACTALCRT